MHDERMPASTVPALPAVPVLTVSSVDPVLRASACAGLLFDLPGAVVVQHDLEPVDDEGASLLRRTVFDTAGTRERAEVRLEHGCLSGALREDVLPTLLRLAAGRPAALVLTLPVTAEPLPVVRALIESGTRAGAAGSLRSGCPPAPATPAPGTARVAS
jgi:hypothetical protein